ncbi:MAG: imidazole glycerol phosphate synthase subunit HisH [Planctomycetota bacterium]
MIQIINTGVANIRSLQAAFDRLGQPWNLTEDPEQIASAHLAVLPGVGAFAAAVESIDRLGIRQIMVDRLKDPGTKTLCICLGMQLLGEASEEAPEAAGLGVVPRVITRFQDEVQVPQLGWNQVNPQSEGIFEAGEAYFANSYRLLEPPQGWGYAETDYGGKFVSSIWRGGTLACQFHPELSGQWGQTLLQNWIRWEQ